MAFLKSSQITGLSARDVDVRGFTQSNSINLGDRAYTEHEVLLADAYNIKGDVTVSDNLILSKLSDDGNAITITGDTTTRTISGSGSIEGATLAQTPNTKLEGMSGTLGSGVTLGSDVVFPTGAVVQTQSYFEQEVLTCTTAANAFTDLGGFNVTITPSSANNKILVMLNIGSFNFSSTNYGIAGAGQLRRRIASGSFTTIGVGKANATWNASFNLPQPNSYQYNSVHCIFLDSPSTTSACTYGIAVVDHNNSAKTFYLNQTGAVPGGEQNEPYSPSYASSIIVQEITG